MENRDANRPTISVCVITYNEEHNIVDCLESVKWADEIIVVDSDSTDRTVELAKNYTKNVIINKWHGYVVQKNFALEHATCDWILCLDADERVTPELKEEILSVLTKNNAADAYYIKRHTYYLGKWINHCGWYPDYKIRLIKRGKGKWDGIDPHDKMVSTGRTDYLNAELHHFTYRNFSHQLKIIDRFSDVATDEYIKAGKSYCIFKMLFHPPLKFLGVYIWKMGFMDGFQGFIIAVASAFYVFSKYVKLWEKTTLQRQITK